MNSQDRWWEQARCAGMELGEFFRVEGEDVDARDEREQRVVRQVCAGCPVATECLRKAIETSAVGVAGGMNENERDRYRRSLLRNGLLTIDRRTGRCTWLVTPDVEVIVCEHCHRRGEYEGPGPRGERLIRACFNRWWQAGCPGQVPAPRPRHRGQRGTRAA
ncbi:hypothetical protein BJF83_22410 [Nocardiopsis sp. CNR-923]|uniref:WhiB family transcriptional regulator n=1 Tax=Nocardiopsis sp. CNR-923 TaxID=1904965 RepID=UPI0009689806|nr:WhiB family transcriptional regulator [Nocardiopsis sp. CNR-923]OLT25837.1 hypothetical protein BJF83_22410 [Nocardiopsis sp. CNR-923]